MCRMVFAIGEFNTESVIRDMILMAADQNERHEENANTVFKHADGWGITYFANQQLKTFRSVKPIFDDPQIEKYKNLDTPFLIVHARYGTKGEVNLSNVHPFEYKFEKQPYVFFHNGTVRDNLQFDGQYLPRGDTDSERFFYYLLSGCNGKVDEVHIRKKLENLKDYSGANFILTNGDQTFITNWYSLNPRYYTMKILKQKNSLIISSEILPHLKNKSWEKLNNRNITCITSSSYFTY